MSISSFSRPKDVYGDEIVMGPFYWAQNRRGKISVGYFSSPIGHPDVILFYVGDAGYDTENYVAFERAVAPRALSNGQ